MWQALKKLPMTVSPESSIYADSAYTDYTIEDDIMEADLVKLMVQRKSNSKRKATGNKVTFENIDYRFFQGFQNFLFEDRKIIVNEKGEMQEQVIKGLNNTTVAKTLALSKLL
jgi:hypothetical protein